MLLTEVVETGDPVFKGYLIPLEGQSLSTGESSSGCFQHGMIPIIDELTPMYSPMGTNVPSIIDPFKLKYHAISFKLLPSHVSIGVTPASAASAFSSDVSVCVVEEDGVMPWLASHVYVGSVYDEKSNGVNNQGNRILLVKVVPGITEQQFRRMPQPNTKINTRY